MLQPYKQHDKLKRITAAQLPGPSKIYFIPVESLIKDPDLFSAPGIIATVPAFTAKLCEAQLINASKDYNEVQKEDDAGDSFEITVDGFLPFENVPLNQTLKTMKYHRYIVLVQDCTGVVKWLGSKENPVKITQIFGSGKRRGSTARGTNLRFFWRSIDKPLIVTTGVPPGALLP